MIRRESAIAVQAMLRSASSTRSGIIATMGGVKTLIVTATAVFSELQVALNLICKVPATEYLGVAHFLKSCFLSLCVMLAIGFLLLVSLVVSVPHAPRDLIWPHDRLLRGAFFKILPDQRVEWQDVWLSAAITSLLFRSASICLSEVVPWQPAMAPQAHSSWSLFGSITRPRSFWLAPNSQRYAARRRSEG